MDINLIIDIDCYDCGENISIPFQFGIQKVAVAYCECHWGVEVLSEAGTLSITRLEGE